MPLPKNIRNYKAYLEKKKRGPVKTFFHITKNENVPAIEKKGLLANHPNANINSAFQPFRKHGSTGGGVWVTTEPTAFPVYGTTIGGKFGDASARAGIFNKIEAGDIDASASLGRWADKVNWDITARISEELFKRMGK